MVGLIVEFLIQVASGLAVAALSGMAGNWRGENIGRKISRRVAQDEDSPGRRINFDSTTTSTSNVEQSVEVEGNANSVSLQNVNYQISSINNKIRNEYSGPANLDNSDEWGRVAVVIFAAVAILSAAIVVLGYLHLVALLFWLLGTATASVASYLYMSNRKLAGGAQGGSSRGWTTFCQAILAGVSSIIVATVAPGVTSPSNGADRSLTEVSAAIGKYGGPNRDGLSGTLEDLFDYLGSAFSYIGEHGPVFLLIQGSTFAFAGVLLLASWMNLWDWLGYMAALRADLKNDARPSDRVSKRAARHLGGDAGAKPILLAALASAVILFVSTGWFFELAVPMYSRLMEWARK
jgi:hypothetical protein